MPAARQVSTATLDMVERALLFEAPTERGDRPHEVLSRCEYGSGTTIQVALRELVLAGRAVRQGEPGHYRYLRRVTERAT